MDDLNLREGKIHTMMFETSYLLSEFRVLLEMAFQSRKREKENYLRILSKDRKEIKHNDFYFVPFNCNVDNLQEEKSTEKLLKDFLLFKLKNDEELLNYYLEFNENLNFFTSKIDLYHDDVKVEVFPTDKTLERIVQSFNISIEYKEKEYIPNYILRNFLIESFLQMNVLQKKPFLLLSYPETDLGLLDVQKFIKLVDKLKVTTIIITTNRDILTSTSEDRIFLIDKNGSKYDMISLKNEINEFKLMMTKEDSLAKKLAYYDFKKDYAYLSKKYVDFLKSNRC